MGFPSAICEWTLLASSRPRAAWLKNINQQYYRFRPDEARALRSELEPLLTVELQTLSGFCERSLTTLDKADEPAVPRLFGVFRAKLGPVGTAKALHALAPTFFPMWDNEIARGYGVSTEGGYFQFMLLAKQQLVGLPADLIPGLSLVKAFDEYNYYKFSTPKKKKSVGG